MVAAAAAATTRIVAANAPVRTDRAIIYSTSIASPTPAAAGATTAKPYNAQFAVTTMPTPVAQEAIETSRASTTRSRIVRTEIANDTARKITKAPASTTGSSGLNDSFTFSIIR